MNQLIASLFSVFFTLLLIAWAVTISATGTVAQHLGIAPDRLIPDASMAFAPIALLYFLSFRSMVITPVLRRWAAQQGVTLGHIRWRSGWFAPNAVRLPFWRRNQYERWYSAEVQDAGRVTGTAYFRLILIAPIGLAIIRAATIEPLAE